MNLRILIVPIIPMIRTIKILKTIAISSGRGLKLFSVRNVVPRMLCRIFVTVFKAALNMLDHVDQRVWMG